MTRLNTSDARIPTVLVYAEPLLAPTMTFVRSQALALQGFTPVFASAYKMRNGLALPEDRVVTIQGRRQSSGLLGKIREVPLKVFGYDPLFFRKVRRFDPLLVHAHFGPAALTALPLARSLKVPLVASFHGFDATVSNDHLRNAHFQSRVYARRKTELWDGANLLIAVSKFIKDRLLQQGCPEKKVVVHYIGVDTDFFAPDHRIPREPIVLFVASLHEGKGCEYVIRAMEKVQAVLPEVELIIIGDGPLRPSLESMATGTLKRYKFLGLQPPEVVRQWMNRAKVFSVASVTAKSGATEAFGLVYAESQAMGLPVTSFASGGVPEAVAHGETGFLAREKDWQGLARYILDLLQNEALWQRISKSGQRRVQACFNLQTQTRELEQVYASALSRHARPSAAADG